MSKETWGSQPESSRPKPDWDVDLQTDLVRAGLARTGFGPHHDGERLGAHAAGALTAAVLDGRLGFLATETLERARDHHRLPREWTRCWRLNLNYLHVSSESCEERLIIFISEPIRNTLPNNRTNALDGSELLFTRVC